MQLRHRLLAATSALALFVGLPGTVSQSNASNFAFEQYIHIEDDPFFAGSQNLVYDYNSGAIYVSPWNAGDYYAYFSLPFNSDLGIYHYSYEFGRYTEALYLSDYAL